MLAFMIKQTVKERHHLLLSLSSSFFCPFVAPLSPFLSPFCPSISLHFSLLPLSSFPLSKEANDAARNDKEETIPPEIMAHLKDMGAFGLQVPTDFKGLGLTNTQYARLTEIIGGYDLGVGIMLGAHQVRRRREGEKERKGKGGERERIRGGKREARRERWRVKGWWEGGGSITV